VLVVGLALGTILVAAIAELVALGSVVRTREAAQAAADAGALENAIWHARGMNTAAALNIVMGSASAVLVLWRLMLATSTLARLLALAVPLGTSAPHASGAAPLAPLLEADAGVQERVRAMLAGLAAAQASVAEYTPLLAARSAAELGGAAEHVESFSASAWAAARGALPARLASPISLPLEAEPSSLLCAQPGPAWHDRVSAAIGRMRGAGAALEDRAEPSALAALGIEQHAEPSRLVVRWAGLSADMAPGVFCSPAAAAVDGLAFDRRALAAAERRRVERGAAPASDVARALEALARPGADSPAARVWSPAQNGNVYLRSAAQLASGVVAHAEMYFDCDETWERCVAQAAWQPRWRARLRRVRPLSRLLAAAGDAPSAWRPGRRLPPAEPAPLGDALPLTSRAAGDDPLARALEDAAPEPRLVH
jgi:hypothetical protein